MTSESHHQSFRLPFACEIRNENAPPSVWWITTIFRAAVLEASRLVPELALLAGGKSFGGRMTSQAQAASPFPGVRGLVFLGFPLHPAGRPSDERGKHLFEVKIPMPFLQGTRDDLANQQLLKALCERIGGCAALKLFQDADHSFHVPARTGRKDAEVRVELLDIPSH